MKPQSSKMITSCMAFIALSCSWVVEALPSGSNEAVGRNGGNSGRETDGFSLKRNDGIGVNARAGWGNGRSGNPNSNSLASRCQSSRDRHDNHYGHSSQFSRTSVALEDSFPCEGEALTSAIAETSLLTSEPQESSTTSASPVLAETLISEKSNTSSSPVISPSRINAFRALELVPDDGPSDTRNNASRGTLSASASKPTSSPSFSPNHFNNHAPANEPSAIPITCPSSIEEDLKIYPSKASFPRYSYDANPHTGEQISYSVKPTKQPALQTLLETSLQSPSNPYTQSPLKIKNVAANNLLTKIQLSNLSALSSRGGESRVEEVVAVSSLKDEDLDQIVDDLIAGVEFEEDSNDSIKTESHEEESVEEEEEEEDDKEETEEDVNEEHIDTPVMASSMDVEEEASEDKDSEKDEKHNIEANGIAEDMTIDTNNKGEPNAIVGQSTDPLKSNASPAEKPATRLVPTTPTNAYYRFLLRRGPKGHILATFSLLFVQWTYIYLPFLYNTLASLLLKCRIYDPQVLWRNDRLRHAGGKGSSRSERKGTFSSIKNKFLPSGPLPKETKKSIQRARKQQQKQKDEEATSKLSSLYKLQSSMPTSMAEVRYRYLSVGFRKRHGLGKLYRVEKPRTFMGEKLEGVVGEEDVTNELNVVNAEIEIFVSDDEREDDESQERPSKEGLLSSLGQTMQTQKLQQQQQQQTSTKRKYKKVNDWVVRAFASPKKSSSVKTGERNSSSSLWNTLIGDPSTAREEQSGVLQAAWDSRHEEQKAWQQSRQQTRGANDGQNGKTMAFVGNNVGPNTGGSDNGGGNGSSFPSNTGSKMFQSVMSRVGSNGRILGAYPMDAPPIDECVNARGVLTLARRYGYGDWKRDIYFDSLQNKAGNRTRKRRRNNAEEEEEESWGGGDLLFDDDEKHKDADSSYEPKRRSRRKNPSMSVVTAVIDDKECSLPLKPKRKRSESKKPSRDLEHMSARGGTIDDAGVIGGNSSSTSRLTFEFGLSSSSSQKMSTRTSRHRGKQNKFPNLSNDFNHKENLVTNNRLSSSEIRSQLQAHKSASSLIFSSDARIKAPMEIRNKVKSYNKEKENKD